MARDELDTQTPLKIAFIHPDLGIGKKVKQVCNPPTVQL
jgi:hypothetical protein